MTQARSRKHKTVRVNFRAVCSETKWGDTLVVVGSSIGGWSPSSGLRMVTDGSLYPEWNCAAAIELSVRDGSRGTPGGYATEYKLVILRADGSEEWEPLDGNRRIDVGGSAESVRVASTWGRAAGPHDTTVLGPGGGAGAGAASDGESPAGVTPTVPSGGGGGGRGAPSMLPPSVVAAAAAPPPGLPPERVPRVGEPLEPIVSMDMSWPPSVASSIDGMVHAGSLDNLLPSAASGGSFGTLAAISASPARSAEARSSPRATPPRQSPGRGRRSSKEWAATAEAQALWSHRE